MKRLIKKIFPKIAVFILTLVFLVFQTVSPALAATVSDSYADSSKIDTGNSSNYLVSGGQLKLGSPPPNVAWWKMDETSNSTAADSSGNGNNCVTAATIVAGKYGNARSFNGSTSCPAADSTSLRLQQFTIAAWIKPTTTFQGMVSDYPMIGSKQNWTNKTGYLFGIHSANSNNLAGRILGGTNKDTPGYVESSSGSWIHVALTWDGTYLRVFKGAVQQVATNIGAYTLTHGSESLSIGSGFEGVIDDLRIYNYARDASQIADDMNYVGYDTSATIQSTNLLSGESNVATGINSFVYNLSSKPSGTTATVQFSQDATNWYNSSGTSGGTDTLTTGVNNTIDLSGLAWDGNNFYYKIAFGGDGTNTPVMDDITLNYSSAGACSFTDSTDNNISESCAFSSSIPSKAADVITSANDGTVTGTTIVKGKYGSARRFNGTSDYITVTGYKGISGSSARTVEAWIKTSSATNQSIVSWGADTAGQKYHVRIDSTNGNALRIETSGGYKYGLTNLADGSWHHIAVTFSGTDTTDHLLFVDGNSESTGNQQSITVNTDVATNDVRIGSDPIHNRYFNGSIDDVRIYNYARSESQINEDLNNPITTTGNAPVGHWEMDDGYVDGVDNGNLTVDAGQTLTVNAGQTIVWNSGKSITIADGGSIALNTGGRLRQAYLWVRDADEDGYPDSTDSAPRYSETAPAKAARRYLAATLADCNDSDPLVTTGSTYYQDSDGDTYGNPSVSTSACSQPGGYVSNNTDCYDANANAKPGQTTCYTTNRGDGSFDYDCSGAASNCNTCNTGSSSTPSLAWRQCSGGFCWTDPGDTYFTGYTCSGSTSTCGAGGVSCTGSKASACVYSPCSLSSYYATGTTGCTVRCR